MWDFISVTALIATISGGSALLSVDEAHEHLSGPDRLEYSRSSDPSSDRTILTSTPGTDGRLYVNAEVNDHAIRLMVDTGANATILSRRDAELAGVLITGETRLATVGGFINARTGRAKRLAISGRILEGQRVLVVDGIDQSLMGVDSIRAVGLKTIQL